MHCAAECALNLSTRILRKLWVCTASVRRVIPPTSVKFTREEDATNAANFVIEEDDDDSDDDEGMAKRR